MSTRPSVQEGVRYHSPLRRRVASAEDLFNAVDVIAEIGLAVGALLVFGAAALLGVPLVWAIVVLGGLVLAVFGLLVLVESRSSLIVVPDGVVVVNGLRRRHLAWSDLSRFEAGDGSAEAVLVAGSRVPIRGLRDRTGFGSFWLIQGLNDRLASMRRGQESGFWGAPPL